MVSVDVRERAATHAARLVLATAAGVVMLAGFAATVAAAAIR